MCAVAGRVQICCSHRGNAKGYATLWVYVFFFFWYINFKLYLAGEEDSFEAKMIQGQRWTSLFPPHHDLGRQSQTWVNLLSKMITWANCFFFPIFYWYRDENILEYYFDKHQYFMEFLDQFYHRMKMLQSQHAFLKWKRVTKVWNF